MKIRGIVFDLGHTLMDFPGEWGATEELAKASLFEFLKQKKQGVPMEAVEYFSALRYEGHLKADIEDVEYTAAQALLAAFLKYSVNGKNEKLLEEALVHYFRPELETWRPLTDSVKVLETLKTKGYRVGLISNATDHTFILNCLMRFGFHPYLDPALSSAAFPVRKPHPAIFSHVANAWGIPPQEIAMVGDQLYFDVYGAHQAGMHGVWFEQKTDKAHTFIPEGMKGDPRLVPDKTIGRLSELIPWLEGGA